MERNIFSVSQVNRYVRQMLDSDALTAGLFISGEISNFSAPSSGHIYFTLKDENAAVSAAMFKNAAVNLQFTPASGMEVIVFGRLGLYEKIGQYQLYAEFMEPAGIGAVALALDELKEKLTAEGLFALERKREIPQYAGKAAIITSPTGAALQDMLKVIRGRNPATKILLRPVLVQGEGAAADMVQALAEVNANGTADVIIIGRGGGSAEDLSAFNDENLTRAIANSQIPVISAVGHETDISLADFAADLRAPTPTAAAAIATFDAREVLEILEIHKRKSTASILAKVEKRKGPIKLAREALLRGSKMHLSGARRDLTERIDLLEKVSPYAAWRRGFALVNGGAVRTVQQAKQYKNLTLEFSDGKVEVDVREN